MNRALLRLVFALLGVVAVVLIAVGVLLTLVQLDIRKDRLNHSHY